MQTRHSPEPLQQKTWQLETETSGAEGYLYHCILCDEALVLSRTQITPSRIGVSFERKCPGCGFELDSVLSCKSTRITSGRRLLASLKCRNPEILAEKVLPGENQPQRARILLSEGQSNIPSGIDQIDETLVLTRGQLCFLQGEQSHSLSLLYCAKTSLPQPQGLNSNVIFIDAGNLFDTTDTSQHVIVSGLDNSQVQERIHLSRAFTHHQVYNLIMDKLPSDIEEYRPSLAVVSDMTALFCDPDVREKRESLKMFKEAASFLARLAGKHRMLVLVTSTKTRNKKMEEALSNTANVSALLSDQGFYTQLKITRHPFLQEGQGVLYIEHEAVTRHFKQG